MDTFTLNTGAKMPRIGLGTYKSEPEKLKGAITEAINAGYRMIDCAALYGNEKDIGDALAAIFAEGKVKREDLFIVSKLWNTEHRPERVLPAYKKTLADLKLDYLDLYLMHWPVAQLPDGEESKDKNNEFNLEKVPVEVTWKAMEELYEKGLVKAIGVSNFTIGYLYNLLCGCKIRPAVNQVEMHPFLQQRDLVEFCNKEGIAVTAFCPLARPGKEPNLVSLVPRCSPCSCPRATPSPSSSSSSSPLKANASIGDVDVNISTNKVIVDISKKHGKSPAQIVLRWFLQLSPNVIAVPKSTTPGRPTENYGVFDFELTKEEMSEIEGLDFGYQICPGRRLYNLPFN